VRAPWIAAFAALVLVLGAPPAKGGGSSDVGGSWELKISCKGTVAAAPSKRKQTLFLPIVQGVGGDLQAGAGDTGPLIGYVLFESAKPERARITLVGCDVSTLSGVVIQAAGKLAGDAGRMKGTAIFVDSPGEEAEICKVKLERTNAMGAPVLDCS
jgi:hypothetical protein